MQALTAAPSPPAPARAYPAPRAPLRRTAPRRDDTILPSSWLKAEGMHADTQNLKRELQHLSCVAQRLIFEAKRMGCAVFIVTNAEEGWVQSSCRNFLPSLWPSVVQTPVTSARAQFSAIFPNTPAAWKAGSFAWHVHMMISADRVGCGSEEPASVSQVVSIGDANFEHQAAKIVADQLQCKVKTLRIAPQSSAVELAQQLEDTTRRLPAILQAQKDVNWYNAELFARRRVIPAA